jgi:hypothetical protein
MRLALVSSCLLSLSAGSAAVRAADWREVNATDDGTRAIDFSSIKKTGPDEMVVWVRISFSKDHVGVGGSKYRSSVQLMGFRCNEGTASIMQLRVYSGPNGEGRVVFSGEQPPDWQHVPPDSDGYSVLKVICAS